MHAVLDGEATPDETRELERQLAADPAARAEFDELRRLFDELSRVPKAYPPEGLVASVMARVSQRTDGHGDFRQPFARPRVIGRDFRDSPGFKPGEIGKGPSVPGKGLTSGAMT